MNFILITGPPAVGKMTVGQALKHRTDYPLFHNHLSIELALEFGNFGTPEMKAVNEGIRKLVFKTVSESRNLKGFIFTLVWAFQLQEDWNYVDQIRTQFAAEGWDFYIVELFAKQEIRLQRNRSENRLLHKPSKRNLDYSENNLRQIDEEHQVNSGEMRPQSERYLFIDNSDLSAEEVADQIVKHFQLQSESS